MDGNAIFFEGEVSDHEKVKEIFRFTLSHFGRLDILLNNAAYMDFSGFRPVADVPVEIWERAISIGFRRFFLGCKYAFPAMMLNQSGVIINNSSFGW